MAPGTQAEVVLELARRRGLLRPRDLAAAGIPRAVLSRLQTSGQLVKVTRGLYRMPEDGPGEDEGMVTVARRVPHAVFCLLTALQFHGLTTQLPRQIWIAMPRGSHAPRIDHPPIRMAQFTGESYSGGIEIFERDRTQLRVYGVAKTVADCFKYRNRVGLDVALEALKDSRQQAKASADDLWRFARICRVSEVMRPYLEAVG